MWRVILVSTSNRKPIPFVLNDYPGYALLPNDMSVRIRRMIEHEGVDEITIKVHSRHLKMDDAFRTWWSIIDSQVEDSGEAGVDSQREA